MKARAAVSFKTGSGKKPPSAENQRGGLRSPEQGGQSKKENLHHAGFLSEQAGMWTASIFWYGQSGGEEIKVV